MEAAAEVQAGLEAPQALGLAAAGAAACAAAGAAAGAAVLIPSALASPSLPLLSPPLLLLSLSPLLPAFSSTLSCSTDEVTPSTLNGWTRAWGRVGEGKGGRAGDKKISSVHQKKHVLN